MAAHRRDAGRPDEHPGPGRPLRRRNAETLVCELDDDGVRRLRDRAHPLGPGRIQNGLRGPDPHLRGHQRLLREYVGKPASILNSHGLLEQAHIRELAEEEFLFPMSTLAYFQIVFAAITPILMLGSVLGRFNFKAWIPFVALWTLLIYTVNAFMIWGGGFFAQKGCARLLRRLRHPPRGRRIRIRRGSGDRTTAPTRPRGRRTEQPGDGRGRRRPPLDGLERLQRR